MPSFEILANLQRVAITLVTLASGINAAISGCMRHRLCRVHARVHAVALLALLVPMRVTTNFPFRYPLATPGHDIAVLNNLAENSCSCCSALYRQAQRTKTDTPATLMPSAHCAEPSARAQEAACNR